MIALCYGYWVTTNLSNIKFDEDQYKHEWKHVLNDVSLDYNQKVEMIKEKLISYDCFVVEEPKTKFKMSLFLFSAIIYF